MENSPIEASNEVKMKIAVIPARGGSKRIPRKNIKDFCGKPMIAWSIGAAQACGLFDHIIVSTDDAEIAEVAKTWGAEVPFMRPVELSNDFVGTRAVTLHALEWAMAEYGNIAYVCTIYATAPFIKATDLSNGLALMVESGKSLAFTVTSFPYPIQRALLITKTSGVAMFQPEYLMTRSQDLQSAYHDAGQFYWAKAEAIMAGIPTFSEDAAPLVLPHFQVQDIDTKDDWLRAELMFKAWGSLPSAQH